MALASVAGTRGSSFATERLHEQSYLQATMALLKVRKQTAASRPEPAAREIAATLLLIRPRVRAPGTPDPTLPAGARLVAGRSEHRSLGGNGNALTAGSCAGGAFVRAAEVPGGARPEQTQATWRGGSAQVDCCWSVDVLWQYGFNL